MKRIVIYTSLICPYCVRAKNLLNKKGVTYKEKRVDLDPSLAEEAMQKSGGITTVPQIFIDDYHVGGCDELYALDQSGKLDRMLHS